MDIERYNEFKNFILEKFQIPEMLIEDYSKVQCRVTTARFLMNFEKYKDSLDLLLTIGENDIEEIEQWIWVLEGIGLCYWRGYDNKEKALEYLKKADELAAFNNEEFSLLVRGEIWANVLYCLKELNRNEELKSQIKSRIEFFKNRNEHYKSNSYLFYAYKFLATSEPDINEALEHLYKAMEYFPLNEKKQKVLKRIWEERSSSPNEAFEQIIDLTHHEVWWEI